MSASPDPAFWRELLLGLALATTAAVALTALLSRLPRAAAWRRAVWRVGFVSLAALLLTEATGAAGVMVLVLTASPPPPAPAVVPRPTLAQRPQRPARAVPLSRLPRAAPVRNDYAGPLDGEAVPSGEPTAVWWPGVVWLAGASLLTARAGVGRILLLIFRRRCPAAAEGELRERVRSVARRLGLRRPPAVLQASGRLGPAAFGVWRPTLVLPARFAADFTPAAQEAMLAHELAHLAAHDPAWLLFADLVVAALWWQPLAWWARQRLRAAAEDAADEASLVAADGPAVLAATLVELGTRLVRPRRPGWLPMAGSGFRSGLGRRVERLLRLSGGAWRPPGRLRAWLLGLLGPAALALAAVLSTSWARSHTLTKGDLPMNSVQQSWKRSLAGLVVCATLGAGGDAAWADNPSSTPGGGPAATKKEAPPRPSAGAKKEGKASGGGAAAAMYGGSAYTNQKPAPAEQPQLKVFRLRHQDPQALVELADHLIVSAAPGGQPPGMGAGVGFGGGMMPGGLSGMPGGGALGMGGAGFGALGFAGGAGFAGGGGFMGQGGQGPVQAGQPRFAVDGRTRTLIVRGFKRDIQAVSDLVSVLDLPPGKAPPKLKNLRVFTLRHADPDAVVGAVEQLDIGARIALVPETKNLLVMGSEPQIHEVSQVVEALDVQGDEGAPAGSPKKAAPRGKGKRGPTGGGGPPR